MSILFRSSSTISPSTTTSRTISAPAGVQEHDLLILCICKESTDTMGPILEGWEEIPYAAFYRPNRAIRLYQRYAGASEPADYSYSIGTGANIAGVAAFYSDTPGQYASIEAHTTQNNSFTEEMVFPSVPVSASSGLLACFGAVIGNASSTPPVGMTEHWDTGGATRIYLMTGSFSGPGATGTRTATVATSSFSSRCISLALVEGAKKQYPYPIIRSVESFVVASDNPRTFSRPGNVEEGDLLIFHLATSANVTPTLPSGWTEITAARQTGTNSLWLFYKYVGPSEPSTYAVSFSGATNSSGAITTWYIPDGTPVEIATVASQSNAASVYVTFPSVTVAYRNATLCHFATHSQNIGIEPQGYNVSEVYDAPNSSLRRSLAKKFLREPGDTGVYTSRTSIEANNTSRVATVALVPQGSEVESYEGEQVTGLGTLVEISSDALHLTNMGVLAEIGNDTLNVTLSGAFVELEYTPEMATYFPEPITFKHEHRQLPEPVTGYQLDSGGSFWSVVMPKEGRNLVVTPSFQKVINTFLSVVNWSTWGRSHEQASRGFNSLKLTPTPSIAGYVQYSFFPTVVGYYVFGLDLYLHAGQTVRIAITNVAQTEVYSSAAITAPSTGWRRYHIYYYESSPTTRYAELRFNSDNSDVRPIYTDGWLVMATQSQDEHTYFDGDTREDSFSADPYAYGWEGSPHESYSVQSGRNMAGGVVKSLYDLDFRTTAILGLGLGDSDADIVRMISGEEILRGNTTGGKEFSIIGKLIACNIYELQKKRSQLTDFFNTLHSRVGGVALAYQAVNGDGVPVGKRMWMNVAFLGGLAGKYDNLYQETVELRFKLLDGKLREEFGNVVELAIGQHPEPESLIYSQDPRTGQWETYGVGGNDTIGGDVLAVLVLDTGHIVVGGSFTAIGGVSANYIARWNPFTKQWSQLGGGLDGPVHALARGRGQYEGYVLVGGDFTEANGSVEVKRIAAYHIAANTWHEVGSGVDSIVSGIEVHPHGQVFIWGTFTEDGDENPLEKVTYYDARIGGDNSWHNLGITTEGAIRRILISPDLNIYFAGTFSEVNSDEDVNGVAYFDLVEEGFPLLGIDNLNKGLGGNVHDLVIGADGYLYAIGTFLFDANGVPMQRFARYNGAIWEEVGRGEINVLMHRIVADKRGNFYISMSEHRDNFDADIFSSTLLYGWNGSSWFPPDIRYYHAVTPPSGRTTLTPDGRFFLPAKKPGMDTGVVHLSGYTKVKYQGTADAPVKFQIIGPCVVHRISNWTTGKHIYFKAFELLEDEEFTLDLTSFSSKAFSTLRNDMLHLVLSGPSNLTDFRLVPGDNHITVLTSGEYEESTKALMVWQNHYWSIDEGLQA